MPSKIDSKLQDWFRDSKNVVLAGIGNPIRSDDNVGLKIVEALQGKFGSRVCLLECETVPESYIIDIEKFNPTHVLLIDAATLGHAAGEPSLVELEEVPSFPAISSHILPLRIFCEYIKKTTKAHVGLLLIEPKSIEFGENLSVEVQKTAVYLTKLLIDLLS
jgi:hydrogenase 3 maturation protease